MLSLCITTYNRFEMTMESFAQVLSDHRINEIVIVDDCSEIQYYDKLAAATLDMPKVRLFRNDKNLGMSLNKKRAVELAKGEWCILFDSDNVIEKGYLDSFFYTGYLHAAPLRDKGLYDSDQYFHPDYIYCPSFAKPRFDYRTYDGGRISRKSCRGMINDPVGELLMNTCNYIVNRSEYLKVYEHNPEMKGTDTIWFNYLWLKAGNFFYVVPGMEYEHRIHDGSGFLADCDYNMKKAKEVKQLIKTL